jgi:hypothetical protein
MTTLQRRRGVIEIAIPCTGCPLGKNVNCSMLVRDGWINDREQSDRRKERRMNKRVNG